VVKSTPEPRFRHERHKSPSPLPQPRDLIIACPPLRSKVNLSRIVRTASCCGVRRIITNGSTKIDPTIARDGADQVEIESRRSIVPVLKKLKENGFQIVGLEQTTNSKNLHHFQFARKTVLVVGHERHGLTDDVLGVLDHAVEIPVYGLPFSYNVATATSMALYEYCRQFPGG